MISSGSSTRTAICSRRNSRPPLRPTDDHRRHVGQFPEPPLVTFRVTPRPTFAAGTNKGASSAESAGGYRRRRAHRHSRGRDCRFSPCRCSRGPRGRCSGRTRAGTRGYVEPATAPVLRSSGCHVATVLRQSRKRESTAPQRLALDGWVWMPACAGMVEVSAEIVVAFSRRICTAFLVHEPSESPQILRRAQKKRAPDFGSPLRLPR